MFWMLFQSVHAKMDKTTSFNIFLPGYRQPPHHRRRHSSENTKQHLHSQQISQPSLSTDRWMFDVKDAELSASVPPKNDNAFSTSMFSAMSGSEQVRLDRKLDENVHYDYFKGDVIDDSNPKIDIYKRQKKEHIEQVANVLLGQEKTKQHVEKSLVTQELEKAVEESQKQERPSEYTNYVPYINTMESQPCSPIFTQGEDIDMIDHQISDSKENIENMKNVKSTEHLMSKSEIVGDSFDQCDTGQFITVCDENSLPKTMFLQSMSNTRNSTMNAETRRNINQVTFIYNSNFQYIFFLLCILK